MIYRNPDLKKNMLPTLDQIKKYLSLASDENLKTRDVRKLMSFLQRLPQVDRYFLGLLQTRKIALLGFPYTIKFPDEIKADERDKKKLEEMKIRFVKSKMHLIFNTLMNGIIFGMSAAKLERENIKPFGTMVTSIKNLSLTELDYNLENGQALDFIESTPTGYKRDTLDPELHIFMKYNPLEGIDDDYPGSFARSNMLYIWLKYQDFFNWSAANEKWGDPLVVAQFDKERTEPKDLAVIQQGLEALGTAGKAMFSKDVELKFLEAMRSGITDMHDRFIEAVNTEMAVSILGQTLTTEIKDKGTFAAAKVHNFVRQDILYSDIIEFQNVITSQYIYQDWILNYGEPKNSLPIFEFDTDEIQDFESNARTFETLKAAYPDIKIKQDELYKRTGWTMPAEGDITI